jgi:RNA polymerase sigma-70 factor (ECF subfamily)
VPHDSTRRALDAAAAAELAARESYGRLLARLAVRTRDITTAEDALSDAFLAALAQWPQEGVPQNPDAWLMQVAKRRLIDEARHHGVRGAAEPMLTLAEEVAQSSRAGAVEDERIVMCYLCAHPDIDPAARAPLMLQLVLGLDAARIAAAFLTSPTTMSQRLVRAKQRIRDAQLVLERPAEHEIAARTQDVLDAIYAAYGTGWDETPGAEAAIGGLRREALWLVRIIAAAQPVSAEALGLFALLLFCESRQAARRSDGGDFVPLHEQDVTRWDRAMIAEAEEALSAAAALGVTGLPGRFQLEAAVQSVHARRAIVGHIDWETIVQLYLGLLQVAPSVGAAVAHAAALGEGYGARSGLDALDGIPSELVRDYQPYWAVRAEMLRRSGSPQYAAARDRALGLTTDPAVRRFLLRPA